MSVGGRVVASDKFGPDLINGKGTSSSLGNWAGWMPSDRSIFYGPVDVEDASCRISCSIGKRRDIGRSMNGDILGRGEGSRCSCSWITGRDPS